MNFTQEQLEKIHHNKSDDRMVLSTDLKNMIGEQPKRELSSGLGKLDDLIDGFIGGELTTVSGFTGHGKCHGKGTKILMYNGTIKNVEDVMVGDQLMGDDSLPRNVLSLGRGKEMIYKIIPIKGESYTVNESHILSLKKTGVTNYRYDNHIKKLRKTLLKGKGTLKEISVKDYINSSDGFKHIWKGYRVPIEFKEKKLLMPPYILGLWLGGGTSISPDIETMDQEIVDEIKNYAEKNNWEVRVKKHRSKSKTYCIVKKREKYDNSQYKNYKNCKNRFIGKHCMKGDLKKMNLINNKHIPDDYKINNRINRLELLAGLIDTDGYTNDGVYLFVNKNLRLINDMSFLAQSLGFGTKITPFLNKKFQKTYYRLGINGDCSVIPVRIKRKKLGKRRQKKDVLVTGIKIEKLGIDNYYGFEIDGNHRYLLGDFTVTHNTLLLQTLTKEFVKQGDCPAWFTFEVRPAQFLSQFGSTLPVFTLPAKHKDKSLDWIEEHIVEAQLKYDSKVFCIDHLHYIVDMASKLNMSLEIGTVMRRLKSICVDYNMIGFIVAHLQKVKLENKDGGKREPELGDTRDSSFAEQESDNVFFVWRSKDRENGGCLKVAKNRRKGVMGKTVPIIKRGYFLEVDYEGKEQGKII